MSVKSQIDDFVLSEKWAPARIVDLCDLWPRSSDSAADFNVSSPISGRALRRIDLVHAAIRNHCAPAVMPRSRERRRVVHRPSYQPIGAHGDEMKPHPCGLFGKRTPAPSGLQTDQESYDFKRILAALGT
jgi:hypothetical protein